MATAPKAFALIADIASELSLRSSVSALAQTQSTDTDGFPTLLVGAASTTAEGFFLKIAPETSLFKDAIGNTQVKYTGLVAQVVFEANYAGSSDGVADVQKWTSKLPIIAMLGAKGLKIEVYESSNGTAPTAAGIAANKLKATFELSAKWGSLARS